MRFAEFVNAVRQLALAALRLTQLQLKTVERNKFLDVTLNDYTSVLCEVELFAEELLEGRGHFVVCKC